MGFGTYEPGGPEPLLSGAISVASTAEGCGCYLCGCPEWKEILTLRTGTGRFATPYTLWRCCGCSLEFLWPLPEEIAPVRLYDLDYYRTNYLAYEAERRTQFVGFLDRMSVGGMAGPIIDVGCGTGLLVSLARQRGYEAFGVEPSPAARQIAREHYGLELQACLAELARLQFRTAVFWQVLAHVADPVALLRESVGLLESHGRVIMSFCNWRDPHFRFAMWEARLRCVNTIHVPTILWRFREDHIAALAGRAGLRVARFTYWPRPVRRKVNVKRAVPEQALALWRMLAGVDEEIQVLCEKV